MADQKISQVSQKHSHAHRLCSSKITATTEFKLRLQPQQNLSQWPVNLTQLQNHLDRSMHAPPHDPTSRAHAPSTADKCYHY